MAFTLENFYRSDEWEKFRNVVIGERTKKDGFIYCERCGEPIVNKYDLILHHITELTEANVNDYMVSLNPENIKVLHFKCHNAEHGRFGFDNKKNIYIVYGSPLSGKTTWVHSVASPNDLIVDLDAIHEAISINRRYYKSNRLNSVVFDVRDLLFDKIKYRDGKFQDCYVIGGYPFKGDRERLAKRLNAKLVFIECEKDVCLERCYKRFDDEKKIAEWKSFIDDWFEHYQP